MLVEIQNKVSVNDCIAFQHQSRTRLGRIVEDRVESLVVLLYNMVTSEISRQHSLKPLTAIDYPMAYHGNMLEVLESITDRVSISRQSIIDIVFIVPIMEVESGVFHIAGSKVTYFSRYFIQADRKVKENKSKFYFDRYIVEPLTHRLFSSLNYLAHNLRRAMYHLRESDISSKSFRIFFSMESFLYLCHKIPNAIKASIIRNERSILYYNNLQMESRGGTVTKNYLRILNKQSMSDLRHLLGDGVGLGITTTRPTKKCRFKYCTVNGKLNSVEVEQAIPYENVLSPLKNSGKNGIDFVFTEESRMLTCIIRFTSITVSQPEIVISRVPKADVKQPESGVYVGAWFLHNGAVLEVAVILDEVAGCKDPDGDDDDALIELPLPLVSELINSFGR